MEYGQDIKDAAEYVHKSDDPTQALKDLKAKITEYVESAYDKLDRLGPHVAAGGVDLVEGSQTDLICVSEGLDATFNAVLNTRDIPASSDRLTTLISPVHSDEIGAALVQFSRNGKA